MNSARYFSVIFFAAAFALVTISATGCKKRVPPPEEVGEPLVIMAPPEARTMEKAEKVAVPEEAPAPVEKVEAAPIVEEEVSLEELIEEAMEDLEAPEKTFHTVAKGECLWWIAEYEDVYGDPFQWPLIYKANRDQIKDPDLIYPDQVFEIPRDATQEEIEAAIHEAKYRGPWSLWDGK